MIIATLFRKINVFITHREAYDKMYAVIVAPQTSALCTTMCSTALGAAIVSGELPAGRGAHARRRRRASTACPAASRAKPSGCSSRWAWSRRAAASASRFSRREVERLRPETDSLATRVRRPGRPTGVALGVAPRIRTRRRRAGRPPCRPAPVPHHGGRRLGHGDARPLRRPRVISVGGQGLPPNSARSQRQRDVPRAQRRRRRGADRPHPSRHDAGTPNPEAIELHDEVARAIRLRDEAAAERAMRAIIDETVEAVSAVAEEFSE